MPKESICNSLENKITIYKLDTILSDNYSNWIQMLHFSVSTTTLKPLLINQIHLHFHLNMEALVFSETLHNCPEYNHSPLNR